MSKSINKTVEQSALDELDGLITKIVKTREEIVNTSAVAQKAFSGLNIPATNNAELNQKLKESDAIIKQLQADFNSATSTIKQLQAAYDALSKSTTNNTNTSKGLTQEKRNEVIQNREVRKELDANAIATSNLTTFMQKLAVERQKASKVVADYNAQIALGNQLTDEQGKELAEATVAFQKYDAAIKAGKKSIGDAREFVGQYERANWGLNNSINQITRELPAFTFNAQTGFLAISNNIPMLVDEINKLKAANKELIAQGQPIKNVLGQVVAAFFSWNTVISLAITLTTLYGKEIGAFVNKLFALNKELSQLEKTQKALNDSLIEGTKNAIKERVELTVMTRAAANVNKPMNERLEIVKQLQKTYPETFGNLKTEQILLGQVAEANKQVNIELLKRARTTAVINKITENESQIIDLQQEQIKNQKAINEAKAQQEKVLVAVGDMIGAEARAYRTTAQASVDAANETFKTTQEKIKSLQLTNEELIKYAELNYIAEVEAEKGEKANKAKYEAEKDYLASIYELEKRRLEILIETSSEISQDEERSLDDRINAQTVFYESSLALAELNKKEQLRLLELETKNELGELAVRVKNGELSEAKFSKIKEAISADSARKRELIELNYLEAVNQATSDTVDKLKGKWNELTRNQALNVIDQQELQEIIALEKLLNEIDLGKLAPNENSIQKYERALDRIRFLRDDLARSAETQRLKEQEAFIRTEIANLVTTGENIERKIDLERELTENLKRQSEIRTQQRERETEKSIELALREKEARNRALEELFASASEFGNQLLQNNVDRYEREIEKSNEHYDNLIANAESGSEQEILLQEEKQRKEDELQKRKTDALRRQAIFNKLMSVAEIGINTAQEISKNNAILGTVLAAPINAIAIASAAIRTATVLATPLPQYKHGRKGGPEEMAVVGDGYVSEVLENPKTGQIRITPDKPVVTKLAKDEIVHSSLEEFYKSKSAIQRASILSSFSNSANQAKDFDYWLVYELTKTNNTKIEKAIEKGFKKAKNNVFINNNTDNNSNYRNRGFWA